MNRSFFGAPLLLPFLAALLLAQSPIEIRPGYALFDDMILPVGPEAVYSSTPWTGGIVYYEFDANVSATNQTRTLDAMAEWEAVANVTFVPRTNQSNYIHIQDSTQNSSYVGMIGGSQTLNMYNWSWKFIICHELCHALSFQHEQTRPDRDTYVTINTANICCNAGHNFNLNSGATPVGPYDFLSIMHYGRTAFSNGNGDTITCNAGYTQYQSQIGNRSYMTLLDAQGMATRYGAPPPPTITGTTPASVTAGGASFQITVDGTRFNEGVNSSPGVHGSQIVFNGTPLSTTYVSPTRLTATVPSNLIVSGCFEVQVENPTPGGGLSAPWSLSASSGSSGGPFDWVGAEDLSRFGSAIASGHDLDGDGIPDTLIGAPMAGSGAGQAVIFSGADGLPLRTHAGAAGDELGAAVAILGDVNGDGVSDYALGAPGVAAGRVLVFSGATGSLIRSHLGSVANGRFGASLASAGDLNGDGRDELIVGAPDENTAQGSVSIYSGLTGSLLRSHPGASAGDSFGQAVAGGRDANGDGIPDVLVGAPRADTSFFPEGRATLYSGSDGSLLGSWNADTLFDEFGTSVAFLDDLNGDGRCEIAVGMLTLGVLSPVGPGRVRVIDAANDVVLYTVDGDAADDRFGTSLCVLPDLDGDGIAEFAVGAPQTGGTPGPTSLGYATLHSGADGMRLLRVDGSEALAGFGTSVAFASLDHDADGAFELVVGTPDASGACGASGTAPLVNLPVSNSGLPGVLITEVSFEAVEAIEITNFSSTTQDLTSWTLAYRSTALDWHSGPLGVSLAPGEVLVVSEVGVPLSGIAPGTQQLQIIPPVSNLSLSCNAALFDGAGRVRDEVRISNLGGSHSTPGLGGRFRDFVVRSGFPYLVHVERIGSLDTNGAADWTAEAEPSLGLENRSAGERTPESQLVAEILINEITTNPRFVELHNTGATAVKLLGWSLLTSPANGVPHTRLRPFVNGDTIAAGGYLVIGEGPAPSELPVGVPYVQLDLSATLGFGSDEFDLALYDSMGHLVDLVRTKRGTGLLVHNDPRAPSHPFDFVGAAGRENSMLSASLARLSSTDTNKGSDWAPIAQRTMGSANAGFGAPAGWPGDVDVRFNDTPLQGGCTLVINAGPGLATRPYALILSSNPLDGNGPFFGLDIDAILFYQSLGSQPPFSGVLDARGSFRFDLPPATVPGLSIDGMLFVLDPVLGIAGQTMVLEFRS